jgi:regulator of sigma E protease
VIGGFEQNSVAEAAGLQIGDRVISVDDKEVPTWKNFFIAVATRANRPVRLTIERDGKRIERQVTPVAIDRFETGAIGVLPVTHPQIAEVRSGQPGAEGGLRGGDVVMGAAGEANVSRSRLIELIRAHEGKPLPLDVVRGDARVALTLVPRLIDQQVIIGATITEAEFKTVEPGPVEAVKLSLKQNWEWTTLIFETLGGLFTRQTSVKQLMGPVAIADLSGTAAQQDSWIPLFQLMAMISLNLGLLNLMPIPVLDGGHIAILALEGVSRRDFSMKVKEKMLLAGFVLLLMLMVTVIYNDLMRIQWIERLVPWR